MGAPWAAVPLPGGRPVPSGIAVIFQAAISASVIGLPSFGDSAATATEPSVTASETASSDLRVDMLDLPVAADAPAGEAVVVLIGEGHRVGHRLRVSGLVPGAALQHGGLAVPTPRHVEAREGLRMLRRAAQCGLAPALAAVRRDHDLGAAAVAGISDPG